MPELYHVVARAANGVIGKDNQLPWHFPSDMKHFKDLTTGQTVIMGRKTYESIPEKFRPLPNRENIVLSHSGSSRADLFGKQPALRYFSSIETALQNIKTAKAFIIGGASIYQQTLNFVDGIYLTFIHKDYDGDAFYPDLPADFVEESRCRIQDEPLIEVIFYRNQNKKQPA